MMGEIVEFSKGRKTAVLFPCLLEISFRIIKEMSTKEPKEYAPFKNVIGGFINQVVIL